MPEENRSVSSELCLLEPHVLSHQRFIFLQTERHHRETTKHVPSLMPPPRRLTGGYGPLVGSF